MEEKIIEQKDSEYPNLLKEISDAPEQLYIKGDFLPDEKCFAVVGTRLCSNYGKQAALEIAGQLADAGLTIVSGLAPGIDTWAHRAAVEKRKRTISVLGTGLDEKSIYPKENIKLTHQILELGGALVSEYESGTPGSKFTFPERNRIISGLSLGVLIVEAKQRSGSLITANLALKQGRKLFAVPGSIYSSNSKGTNLAIKQLGAKLVESADDILGELGIATHKKEDQLVGDSDEETLILESLKEDALHIDVIIEETSLSTATISGTLTILEIKGKVRNLGGNIFALQK
ncbi:DNA-protecting protein DprA [Patescibacteria group bacterium]|nr:DNA-protecting protein DprA [Patescibacteria group bacterium]